MQIFSKEMQKIEGRKEEKFIAVRQRKTWGITRGRLLKFVKSDFVYV